MTKLEARFPCPVCLGVTMNKTSIGEPLGVTPINRARSSRVTVNRVGPGSEPLMLDHCTRCGGVWFEAGEVQRLRMLRADMFWTAVKPRSEQFRMQCHDCHGFIDRNAETCATCGWKNVLDCPLCLQPMKTATHAGVKLDACSSCKGVWFDHEELASIWRKEFTSSMQKRSGQSGSGLAASDMGAYVVLDALSYSPWLAFEGIRLAGHVVAGSAEALSHAPQVAGAVVDAAGDAASGVFEILMDIIGSLFD
jgi:Zn-finger nucleic acid-binding protein